MKLEKIVSCLRDVEECMNNGMYDLDSNTENEFIETGCIVNSSEEQKKSIKEAIGVIKFVYRHCYNTYIYFEGEKDEN